MLSLANHDEKKYFRPTEGDGPAGQPISAEGAGTPDPGSDKTDSFGTDLEQPEGSRGKGQQEVLETIEGAETPEDALTLLAEDSLTESAQEEASAEQEEAAVNATHALVEALKSAESISAVNKNLIKAWVEAFNQKIGPDGRKLNAKELTSCMKDIEEISRSIKPGVFERIDNLEEKVKKWGRFLYANGIPAAAGLAMMSAGPAVIPIILGLRLYLGLQVSQANAISEDNDRFNQMQEKKRELVNQAALRCLDMTARIVQDIDKQTAKLEQMRAEGKSPEAIAMVTGNIDQLTKDLNALYTSTNKTVIDLSEQIETAKTDRQARRRLEHLARSGDGKAYELLRNGGYLAKNVLKDSSREAFLNDSNSLLEKSGIRNPELQGLSTIADRGHDGGANSPMGLMEKIHAERDNPAEAGFDFKAYAQSIRERYQS